MPRKQQQRTNEAASSRLTYPEHCTLKEGQGIRNGGAHGKESFRALSFHHPLRVLSFRHPFRTRHPTPLLCLPPYPAFHSKKAEFAWSSQNFLFERKLHSCTD